MKKFRSIAWEQLKSEFCSCIPLNRRGHARSDEVLDRGSADFCIPYNAEDLQKRLSVEEKVLGYCRRYFLMHYDDSHGVFSKLSESLFCEHLLLIDLGCGPGTSGVALKDVMKGKDFFYIGVDRAPEMIKRAKEFLCSCEVKNTSFCEKIGELPKIVKSHPYDTAIINFSFLLAPKTFRGDLPQMCDVVKKIINTLQYAEIFIVYLNPPGSFHDNWQCVKGQLEKEGFSLREKSENDEKPPFYEVLHRDKQKNLKWSSAEDLDE